MRALNFLIRRSASQASRDHDMYLRAGLVVRLYSSLNAAEAYKGLPQPLYQVSGAHSTLWGVLPGTTRRDREG